MPLVSATTSWARYWHGAAGAGRKGVHGPVQLRREPEDPAGRDLVREDVRPAVRGLSGRVAYPVEVASHDGGAAHHRDGADGPVEDVWRVVDRVGRDDRDLRGVGHRGADRGETVDEGGGSGDQASPHSVGSSKVPEAVPNAPQPEQRVTVRLDVP